MCVGGGEACRFSDMMGEAAPDLAITNFSRNFVFPSPSRAEIFSSVPRQLSSRVNELLLCCPCHELQTGSRRTRISVFVLGCEMWFVLNLSSVRTCFFQAGGGGAHL